MSIRQFNKENKESGYIRGLKREHGENESEINKSIASYFLIQLAVNSGETPANIDWVNEAKHPINNFQMDCYCESGRCFWACFVRVENGRVIAGKTNIELVSEDWETIKKIK